MSKVLLQFPKKVYSKENYKILKIGNQSQFQEITRYVKWTSTNLTEDYSNPRNSDAKCAYSGGPHLASGGLITITQRTENQIKPKKSAP